MSFDAEELFNLLPAVYRLRDAETGGKLRALIDELAREEQIVDADIQQLYDNWFIETCANWVAPYIGDLIGATPLYPVSTKVFSQKAYVANTLGYRRRSGTLAVLEQAAFDVSNWPARAAEFFQLLGWTQNMNHVRGGKGGTLDVRSASRLELVDGAFDFAARTAEVRRITTGRGRYNIPNVGVFLFRLASYPLDNVTARPDTSGAGRYQFHPAGLPLSLFNSRREDAEIEKMAAETDLPVPLRRFAAYEELESVRQYLVDKGLARPADNAEVFAFFSRPIVEVRYRPPDNPGPQPFQRVPVEEMLVCNLEQWPVQRPTQLRAYKPIAGGPAINRPIQLAFDPVGGRILFAQGIEPVAVEVSHYYGFSGDLGGGSYDRSRSYGVAAATEATWMKVVNSAFPAIVPAPAATLQEAVNDWNLQPPGTSGLIRITDSRSYDLGPGGAPALATIQIKEGSRLVIAAADGQRPHLQGGLNIHGSAPAASQNPGSVILDGLLIEGSCNVATGNLGGLTLAHSTLIPAGGALTVQPVNDRLQLRIDRSIAGRVVIGGRIASAEIRGSILSPAPNTPALDAPEVSVLLEGSTLAGSASVMVVDASDSIFEGTLIAGRRQEGCLRFCFVARGSKTPRRYRCQPDLAIRGVSGAAAIERAFARIVPAFTSRRYPQPGFYQLASSAAREIATGAEDGSEMGTFGFLKQPQRETNVGTVLNEYLRASLEASFFHTT